MKKIFLFALVAVGLFVGGAKAEGNLLVFDFKDPKGVNNILFSLDAPLEQIHGSASGIGGWVACDPDFPAGVTGAISVSAASLQVANPVMREKMLGADWLDAEAHPEIRFDVQSVTNIQREGDRGSADVTGYFFLKGVSKEITVPVKAHYLPGKLKARGGDIDGDLLVLRCTFRIKRSDFGIKPGQFEDKVADEITVVVSIAGAAPKQAK